MKVDRSGIIIVACSIAALGSAGCSDGSHNKSVSVAPPVQAAYQAPTSQADIQKFTKTLSPMLDRSPANVRVVNLPGGLQRATIDKGFQNVMIAHRNADGTMSRACVETEEQAANFLAAPTAGTREVR